MHDSKHTNNTLDMSQNQYFQHPEYLTPGKHVYNSNKQKQNHTGIFSSLLTLEKHTFMMSTIRTFYLIEVK